MPIKSYNVGSLNMDEIAAEFLGSRPHSLSEYYAGNGLVPSYTLGFPRPSGTPTYIPSSGTISINNFYGSQRQVVYTVNTNGVAQKQTTSLPPGRWWIYARMVGAGGGGGGGDGGHFGGHGGGGGSVQAKWEINTTQTTALTLAPGGGGGSGTSGIPGWRFDSMAGNKGRSSFRVYNTEGSYWYQNGQNTSSVWNHWWNVNSLVWESIYFPASQWYDFSLSVDDYFILTNQTGGVLAERGIGPSNFQLYFERGWHTLGMRAINYGGPKHFELTIRQSGTLLWWSWPASGGGLYSGGINYLNGGQGGSPGGIGNSGQGGGGGAGTAVIWHSDNDINSPGTVLGIAPGGGGGSGCGRFNPPLNSGAYFFANQNQRGITTNFNVMTSLPPNDPFNGAQIIGNIYPAEGISNYGIRLLSGQGWANRDLFFYPNGSEWDGGAGGGGGGPWGRGGGYRWVWDGNGKIISWFPANEDSGMGGGQGYFYYNPTYTHVFNYDSTPVYFTSYVTGGSTVGTGGLGGWSNPTFGRDGGIVLRISNIDDNVYPS